MKLKTILDSKEYVNMKYLIVPFSSARYYKILALRFGFGCTNVIAKEEADKMKVTGEYDIIEEFIAEHFAELV